jgi:hypothetical protein
MRDILDITGKYFGRLIPLFPFKVGNNNVELWLCECLCGNFKVISGYSLKIGRVLSCGCFKKEKYYHPAKDTRLYRIWKNMRTRCNYAFGDHYHRYGGRGIKVCSIWNSFNSFYVWALANGYSDELTLDRIDNDGDYCPENCRWVSRQRQSNNMSTNRILSLDGESKTTADWGRITGIPASTIYQRIFVLNWSIEEALNTSVGKSRD